MFFKNPGIYMTVLYVKDSVENVGFFKSMVTVTIILNLSL